MPIEGEYEPSPSQFVRDQVETYERTGGREGNRMPPGESGWPIIILTTRGNRSGKLRKTPLMCVEHNGDYAVVASLGGAPKHPVWYYNIRSQPQVVLQDGPEPFDGIARELEGEERAVWWERAVAAYPPYADYQQRTQRLIPVFLIRRGYEVIIVGIGPVGQLAANLLPPEPGAQDRVLLGAGTNF